MALLAGRRSSTCDRVARLLPAFAARESDLDPVVADHVATCLRCQAEIARYRGMLRTLRALRAETAEPPPEVLGRILGELDAGPGPDAWRTALVALAAAGVGAVVATVWWSGAGRRPGFN